MQVVVFSIEKLYFAINTNVVQSINNTMKITKVPKSSKFIKGLINIRGSIKTLVNINLILDIAENSPKENIMILSLKEEDIAIEVDFVKEVLEIEEKDVEALDECDKDYMLGVLKRNNILITVLD
uniref:chemotaxis protein CheW n=1 Tax=Clostridium baratii TaxID=1561 RepID=UPI00374EBBC5